MKRNIIQQRVLTVLVVALSLLIVVGPTRCNMIATFYYFALCFDTPTNSNLRDLLNRDNNPSIRRAIDTYLQTQRGRYKWEQLNIENLNSVDLATRRAAAAELARIKSPAAIQALIVKLLEESSHLRAIDNPWFLMQNDAYVVLSCTTHADPCNSYSFYCDSLAQVGDLVTSYVVSSLIRNYVVPVKLLGAEVLRRIGIRSPPVIKELIDQMSDPRLTTSFSAAVATAGSIAIPIINETIETSVNWNVLSGCVIALSKIHDPSALRRTIDLICHWHPCVRRSALEVLSTIAIAPSYYDDLEDALIMYLMENYEIEQLSYLLARIGIALPSLKRVFQSVICTGQPSDAGVTCESEYIIAIVCYDYLGVRTDYNISLVNEADSIKCKELNDARDLELCVWARSILSGSAEVKVKLHDCGDIEN